MSSELMLTISSINLVAFTIFLIYLGMIQWAAGLDLRLFQIAAFLFIVLALGEIVFAANQLGEASELYAWLGSEANLQWLQRSVYLLAGVLIAVWQHGYLQELDE